MPTPRARSPAFGGRPGPEGRRRPRRHADCSRTGQPGPVTVARAGDGLARGLPMDAAVACANLTSLRRTDTNSLFRLSDLAGAPPAHETQAERERRERTLKRVRGELRRR